MRQQLITLLRSEGRGTRGHWLVYGIGLHTPLLFGIALVAMVQLPGFPIQLTGASLGRYLRAATLVQMAFLLIAGLWLMTAVVTFTIGEARDRGALAFLLDRPVQRWLIVGCKWAMMSIPAVVCAWLSVPVTVTGVYGVLVAVLPDVGFGDSLSTYVTAVVPTLGGLWLIAGVGTLAVANALTWSLVVKQRMLALAAGIVVLTLELIVTNQQTTIGIMGFWLPIATPTFTEADFFVFAPVRLLATLAISGGLLAVGWRAMERRDGGGRV